MNTATASNFPRTHTNLVQTADGRLRGTIAQLAERITMNNVTLGQPELSILIRTLNWGKQVDEVKVPGQRGRPSAVFELTKSVRTVVDFTDVVVTPKSGVKAITAD